MTPEERNPKKTGIVVVNPNDYVPAARKDKAVEEGKKNAWDKAAELAFEANGGKNKYITNLTRKGEMRLIFEV